MNNLRFLRSRIAPIDPSEQQRTPEDPASAMKVQPSSRAKQIPLQPQRQVVDNRSADVGTRTPDSVTMYPSSLQQTHTYKKIEDRASSSMPTSKSIPIAKNLKRTPSELQLMEDEAMADYRDYCMYTRIVSGITGARRHPADLMAINNIVRTRHLPVQDSSSSYAELNSRYSMIPQQPTLPASNPSLVESACRITDDYMLGDEYNLCQTEDDGLTPEEEGLFVMDFPVSKAYTEALIEDQVGDQFLLHKK